MISKENVYLLMQLTDALGEAVEKLEKAMNSGDGQEINKAKNSVLTFQSKIRGLL